jgi:hypothetical protein
MLWPAPFPHEEPNALAFPHEEPNALASPRGEPNFAKPEATPLKSAPSSIFLAGLNPEKRFDEVAAWH